MNIVERISEARRKNEEEIYIPISERHPYLPIVVSVIALIVSMLSIWHH